MHPYFFYIFFFCHYLNNKREKESENRTMKFYYDKKYNFKECFNPATGFYLRTGVLDENGKDSGKDPFMRSFPALIDVGVMGHCAHGKSGLCQKAGIQCYQDAPHSNKPNMTLENYKRIIDEGKNKGLFQVAIGGAGDPDMHEDFEEILKYTAFNRVVPNFTTSGLGMTLEKAKICRKYCGAVAVSWYRSEYTINAIKMLLDAGVKTNIHYVLGKNSIDEAIERLENNDFPKGINAVIFLLHKPVGLGQHSNVLQYSDPRVKAFFELVDVGGYPFKIGFDSCTVPGILNFNKNVLPESVDSCEGGRFSMYITPDMKALPCSFDNQEQNWAYDISGDTIENAWNSKIFDNFRNHFCNSCPSCPNREACYGGCPICRDTVLCEKPTKELA